MLSTLHSTYILSRHTVYTHLQILESIFGNDGQDATYAQDVCYSSAVLGFLVYASVFRDASASL